MLKFELPWDSQPQEAVQVADRFCGRLKFAHIPSIGTFDVASGRGPINESGSYLTGVLPSGISNDAGSTQEHSLTLQASSSLTLISIWRSRSASQYLGADGVRLMLSNRTAGNAGWSWGRSGAAGGGAGGTVTKQCFVLQGVAAYTEANNTIESLVDTPVACRYDKTAGLVSWFRFGLASSANTAASTSPGAGGNLVVGNSGPFGSGVTPWLDRSIVVLAFEGALSDAEIFDLTNSVQAVWGAFAPRSIWVPVSAGGGGSATDLTIQEATHAHTADSPTITVTTSTSLTIADATHAHAADNLTLSIVTVTDLTIAEATHAHTADNLTLTTSGAVSLTIQDATHGHTADAPTVTLGYVDLVIAEALHGHLADSLTLTVSGSVDLLIANALHAHLADTPTPSPGYIDLTIADALHAHAADNLTLGFPSGAFVSNQRTHLVAPQNRIAAIPRERRSLAIAGENRTHTV